MLTDSSAAMGLHDEPKNYTGFVIFHRPGSDFPWEVARQDGAIICACPDEEKALEIIEGLTAQSYLMGADTGGVTVMDPVWKADFISAFERRAADFRRRVTSHG